MKKLIVLVTAVLLVVSLLVGCAGAAKPNTEGDKASETDKVPANSETAKDSEGKSSNLEKSLAADAEVMAMKASDGQPLIIQPDTSKVIPKRPDNPESLPETDPLHWFDLEYAGWSGEKINLPKSPADGSIGKKIILIIHGEHPYYTAYADGAKKVAEAYGMELKIMWPNWDLNTQNQMIDQAINEKPDLIVLLPLDAKATTQQYKKINEAGIPVISNCMVPMDEGLKYCIGWTGPDEWGARRVLSRLLAEKLEGKGGYCILQHNPGGSTFFSRTYGYVTELAKVAPDMKLLDAQAPGFDAEKTKQVTADWITKYGSELKAIIAADDGAQMVGVIEACKQAGRTDIVKIAAGNSKVGMDGVKAGDILAINYESPMANGASCIKMAADWFNGKDILPVYYMPLAILTQENVDEFYPPQW